LIDEKFGSNLSGFEILTGFFVFHLLQPDPSSHHGSHDAETFIVWMDAISQEFGFVHQLENEDN
jgi:hypothetical protein